MDRMLTFMNLLAVATSDHQLTEREIKLLSKRARELNLSDHQYNLAMNRALAQPGEVQIPRRKAEREALLRDMLRVMAADGVLAEVEKQLFAIVAAYMKFDKSHVDKIIDEVLADELDDAPRKSSRTPAKLPGKKTAPTPRKAGDGAAKGSTGKKVAKSAKPAATRRKPKSR